MTLWEHWCLGFWTEKNTLHVSNLIAKGCYHQCPFLNSYLGQKANDSCILDYHTHKYLHCYAYFWYISSKFLQQESQIPLLLLLCNHTCVHYCDGFTWLKTLTINDHEIVEQWKCALTIVYMLVKGFKWAACAVLLWIDFFYHHQLNQKSLPFLHHILLSFS